MTSPELNQEVVNPASHFSDGPLSQWGGQVNPTHVPTDSSLRLCFLSQRAGHYAKEFLSSKRNME